MKLKQIMPLVGIVLLSLTLVIFFLVVPALASSGGPFNLNWFTIDGGGDTSSAGAYELDGTFGQPDAGPLLSGGAYSLQGGFWTTSSQTEFGIYMPAIWR